MTEKKSGYAAHELEQLRAWQALTHKQRIDWLWQAKLFAARAVEAAKKRKDDKIKPA